MKNLKGSSHDLTDVLSQLFPGWTEKIHKKPQSGLLVSGQDLNPAPSKYETRVLLICQSALCMVSWCHNPKDYNMKITKEIIIYRKRWKGHAERMGEDRWLKVVQDCKQAG